MGSEETGTNYEGTVDTSRAAKLATEVGVALAAVGCTVAYTGSLKKEEKIFEANKIAMDAPLKDLSLEVKAKVGNEIFLVSTGITTSFSDDVRPIIEQMPREGVHALAEISEMGSDVAKCTMNIGTFGFLTPLNLTHEKAEDMSPSDRVDMALSPSPSPTPKLPYQTQPSASSAR